MAQEKESTEISEGKTRKQKQSNKENVTWEMTLERSLKDERWCRIVKLMKSGRQ
jgi:hypothetical protein